VFANGLCFETVRGVYNSIKYISNLIHSTACNSHSTSIFFEVARVGVGCHSEVAAVRKGAPVREVE
jgi:hypothetical protein